jgi:IS5 family transposase
MSVMQGFERSDRQLLDAAALAGHLVPARSMFAFLAEHRAEVFPDAEYADLFSPPGVGRPSLPATQMAAVLTLQVLHDYSDRETAEAVRFDVRWKAAIGASLDDPGFDPSSLVYWRNRIAKSERPHRVNDAVKTVIGQTGILKGRRRRAVDSTILADAVATQDTVTQLISAICRVRREVPGAGEQIAAVCTGHDYSAPGKPKIDWDDPAAKDALVPALVNDADALVAAFAGADLEEPAASAVALLALVAGQDVEPAEGSDGTDGRWRIARKVAEDRVISTVDPDARHTRKSPEARRDGYRAHVAACPETGIVTDEKLTRAAGQVNSDPVVAEEFVAGEGADLGGQAGTGQPGRGAPGDSGSDGGDDALAWYGDSAYGTGDLRDAIGQAGHHAVIKPKPVQPAVAGGFTIDDFTVDEQAGAVTCPAGFTRLITPTRNVIFGATCGSCPLRERCTTSKTGRTLSLHPHDGLLRAARAAWAAGPGLRRDYATHRPNVERTVAQVATYRGRRIKLRYRGVTKNNAWLKRRTAALNLRNLLGRGLTRHDGAWVLAT